MRRLVEVYRGLGRRWRIRIPARISPRQAFWPAAGLLWNWRACWVGLHHSAKDRRTCVNLIPFLTIWYTRPGGMLP